MNPYARRRGAYDADDTRLAYQQAVQAAAAAEQAAQPKAPQPDTKAAIQKLMRARRAELRAPEKRQFPGGICCSSTNEYVHAYYRMNAANHLGDPLGFFEPLSTAPTTWPTPIEEEEPMS